MGVAREPPATFAAFCEEAAKRGATLQIEPQMVANSAMIALEARMLAPRHNAFSTKRVKTASFIVNGVVVTPAPS